MKQLKRFYASLIMLAAVFVASNAQAADAAWTDASKTVDKTVSNMLAVIEDPELKKPENLNQLMGKIDTVVSPIVDFDFIAKRVMGRYFRRATDEEMTRFSGVFKTTLLRTYAKAVADFDLKTYKIEQPRTESPEADKQAVDVTVTSTAGQNYSMTFYMMQQGDTWMLSNVMVDGINLRLNFRNQFADLYSREHSVSGVINSWESQVKIPDSSDKADGVSANDSSDTEQ